MKRLSFILWICMSIALVSCAGGVGKKPVTSHLTGGEKETEKGLEWYKKGCYRRSLHHFFRAYELFSMSDLLDGVAMSLNNLGAIQRALGDFEDAIAAFEESYRIYEDLDDQEGAENALSNEAATFIQMGDLQKGEDTLERAFSLSSSKSGKGPSISLLQNQGVLFTKQGRYQEAEAILTTCLNQAERLSPLERASLHFAFGNMMLQSHRPAKAVAAFEKALSLDKQVGFFRGVADDLSSLAEAYIQLGEKEKAVKAWQRGIKILALLDLNHEVDKTMEQLLETAREAKIDMSITEGFVERWRQGRLYESPCEE